MLCVAQVAVCSSEKCKTHKQHAPFKDEAQTALFKDPVRTAQ
jgi:hypothetical protein